MKYQIISDVTIVLFRNKEKLRLIVLRCEELNSNLIKTINNNKLWVQSLCRSLKPLISCTHSQNNKSWVLIDKIDIEFLLYFIEQTNMVENYQKIFISEAIPHQPTVSFDTNRQILVHLY
jgi:hypothetical protein